MHDPFTAAYKNDVEALREAVASGVDPNEPSQRAGTLLLQLACQGNALEAIAYLLSVGADPNRRFTRRSRVDGREMRGHFPLLYVESPEAADLLVRSGANIDQVTDDGESALERSTVTANAPVFVHLLRSGARIPDALSVASSGVSMAELIEARIAEIRTLAGLEPNASAKSAMDSLRTMARELARRPGPGPQTTQTAQTGTRE